MSRSKSPRGLTAEERALWQKAVEKTDQLSNRQTGVDLDAPPLPPPSLPQLPPRPRVSSFQIPSKLASGTSVHAAPTLKADLKAAPLQMDRKQHQRMRRGKSVPDARIDLHGMTLNQAHPRLIGFVQTAYSRGHRMVLVITGKGKHKPDTDPIPTRFGVLKHQVPLWLRSGILAPIVLQVETAHIRHGGEGAYYVYLRRKR